MSTLLILTKNCNTYTNTFWTPTKVRHGRRISSHQRTCVHYTARPHNSPPFPKKSTKDEPEFMWTHSVFPPKRHSKKDVCGPTRARPNANTSLGPHPTFHQRALANSHQRLPEEIFLSISLIGSQVVLPFELLPQL